MTNRVLLAAGTLAIVASLAIGAVLMSFSGTAMPMSGWFSTWGGSGSISMDRAQQSVQAFLDRTGDRDLRIDELMEFQQNFYALVKERSTGMGAFELLVNKSTGAVMFEPGPDMMWNTKYGMAMGRGDMMGQYLPNATIPGAMPVGAADATQVAQTWLDRNLPGDGAGTPDAFYGYYTFHFEKDGVIAGMLSVNGYSSQVWYHTWHGDFIQSRDFGG